MDWFNGVWSQLALYINVPYLLTIMLAGYAFKRYFAAKVKLATVYVVLIMSAVIAIPYWFFYPDVSWVKLSITYLLGTSLHELIFGKIEDFFTKK